jgi:thioredoxin 1
MSHLIPVTDTTFEQDVLSASGLVAVDFWAQWCAPCRILTPILEELAGEYATRLTLRSLDTDSNPVMMTRLGVRSLPTLLFFKDGQLVHRIVGAVAKSRLRADIDRLLASSAAPTASVGL